MTLRTIPPLPGSILRHQILIPMQLSQVDLARATDLSPVRINHIVKGRAPITVEMALRLGQVTGTEAEYWLRLQIDYDLFQARKRLASKLEKLPRFDPVNSVAAPKRSRPTAR
jgi:addiction module HigA family antidote